MAKKNPPTSTTNTTTPKGSGLAADRGINTDTSDIAIAGEQQYIGVPNGYMAYNPLGVKSTTANYGSTIIERGTTDIAPRYKEGDQYAPAGYSHEQIASIQTQLVNAGLLEGSDFTLGRWDDTTAKAYEDILAYANRSGVSASDAIQQFLADPVQSAAKKGAARVIKLTSTDDLLAVADAVATRVRGRKLDPEEAARFAASYRASQAAEQNATYDAAAAGGGTVSDASDPNVAAEAFVRKLHPDEAVATDRAVVADSILKIINGGAPATQAY